MCRIKIQTGFWLWQPCVSIIFYNHVRLYNIRLYSLYTFATYSASSQLSSRVGSPDIQSKTVVASSRIAACRMDTSKIIRYLFYFFEHPKQVILPSVARTKIFLPPFFGACLRRCISFWKRLAAIVIAIPPSMLTLLVPGDGHNGWIILQPNLDQHARSICTSALLVHNYQGCVVLVCFRNLKLYKWAAGSNKTPKHNILQNPYNIHAYQ